MSPSKKEHTAEGERELKILCKFSGRPIGSIGVIRKIEMTVDCKPETVKSAIYSKYEHIVKLKCFDEDGREIELPEQEWPEDHRKAV